MSEEFPFITPEIIREIPAPENTRPFFVLAYYPPGQHWKISQLKAESEIEPEVESLAKKGWAFIRICKLP